MNLGNADLVNVIRVNRKLYSFSHSKKSPLRHILNLPFGWISVHIGSGPKPNRYEGGDQCALEYTVYLKFGEFDANGISKNTYRRPRMNLEFLVFYCDEHFNIDTSDDGSKWPTPDLYINDHPEKAYFEYFNLKLKYRGLEAGLGAVQAFIWYIASVCYRVKELTLNINSEEIWKAMAPFFEDNNITLARPSIFIENFKFDSKALFSSRLFRNGLNEVSCYEAEDSKGNQNDFLLNDKILKSRDVMICDNSIDDGHVMAFDLSSVIILRLEGQTKITAKGVGEFFRKVYAADESKISLHFAFFHSAEKFEYEDVLAAASDIPSLAEITQIIGSNNGSKEVQSVLKCTSGRSYKVRVKKQIYYSIASIETIK
ncbi:hypothetical protein WR25_02919 [Diploscapter pachys]|uniref:Uncharacterized protein n=1 Tax=Diploscapter pachys TaxID=2018661 RepID=A0A2A2JGF7_9BILA|nr:hypothetical protein WR25_02919 [Diploscapter pachys]